MAETISSHGEQSLPFTVKALNCSSERSMTTSVAAVPKNNVGPQTFSHLLPATYRTKDSDLVIPKIGLDYLEQELDVDRLESIQSWLWMAGRPTPPRALHYQKSRGRDIVITQQMDMHLLWAADRIFIKPIPRFLLEPDIWKTFLSCSSLCDCDPVPSGTNVWQQTYCNRCRLRWRAFGFLYSYAGLIPYESDFYMAQEALLLPKELSWDSWRTLMQQMLEKDWFCHQKDNRFLFGELRLTRLNVIYRLANVSLLRGYHLNYVEYSTFLRDNFDWLASVVVYIVIVLTAMQVGLASKYLAASDTFQAASYGFTMFAILGPLGGLLGIVMIFLLVFTNNFFRTRRFYKRRMFTFGNRQSMQ